MEAESEPNGGVAEPLRHFGPYVKAVRRYVPEVHSFNTFESWPGHLSDIEESARRFGFTVDRIGRLRVLSKGGVPYGLFNGLTPSLVSSPAAAVVRNKWRTKQLLTKNLQHYVPAGRQFEATELDQAARYLATHDASWWVVKPVDGKQGEGISVGVATVEDLNQAWDKVSKATTTSQSRRVLIEELVQGVDLRVFVVRGEVVASAIRLPPFTVANGRSTLQELLVSLEQARTAHAYLRGKKIKVDEKALEIHGLRWLDTPDKGEVVFFNSTANLSAGGVSVDVTDEMSQEVKNIAVSATRAIPGLEAAGVDILIPDLSSARGARIIELNSAPNSAVHQYPSFGQPRRVTDAIVRALNPSERVDFV